MSRQAETRAQNRDLVRGDNKPAQVEWVDSGRSGNKKTPNKESSKPTPNCGWCGRERHNRQVCLAKDARLPVTSAKKGDTFKMFVAALQRQQRKYVNWKKMKSRKSGMSIYLLEKFKPQGAVGLPNSGLMAKILALSWILVLQSQSLVPIPRG